MELREAKSSDKTQVLEFCKNTFSWGDYISDVWDSWSLEQNLLVLTEKDIPVAISHCSISDNQVWIEGIRVHENYRRKGFASRLVLELESIAKKKNCKVSKMLIAENNKNSLHLANSLNYQIEDIWNFYSVTPMEIDYETNVKKASNNQSIVNLILSNASSYVRSWRWLPLSKNTINNLINENRIFYSELDGIINAVAILTESDHYEKTLMVTLVFGNEDGIKDIIKYFQNFAQESDNEKIQLLTKINFSNNDNLEKKYTFCLLKKQL
jgi:GNAT superfamily N-acetyltransferase